jgi:CRISPR-associated protein Csm2
MSEIRRAFEKQGIKGTDRSEPHQKRCKCGNLIKNIKFDTCYDCSQKRTGGAGLPEGYLEKGYFKERDILFDDLVTETADNIARSLKKNDLKNHQLRRFYNHVRDAGNKLNMTRDWLSVNIDVKKLKAFAAEAKGKGKIQDAFFQFISKNIDCVTDEKSFIKGFLPHFEAVVAYCTYYNLKD